MVDATFLVAAVFVGIAIGIPVILRIVVERTTIERTERCEQCGRRVHVR